MKLWDLLQLGLQPRKLCFLPRKLILAFPALKEAWGLTSPNKSVRAIRESFHDSAVTQTGIFSTLPFQKAGTLHRFPLAPRSLQHIFTDAKRVLLLR